MSETIKRQQTQEAKEKSKKAIQTTMSKEIDCRLLLKLSFLAVCSINKNGAELFNTTYDFNIVLSF